MLELAIEETAAVGGQIKPLIGETCLVKNSRINHRGFTPYQWVLGKLPVDETSLTSEEAEGRYLGVHEEVLDPEDEFSYRLQVRQAAKLAFAKVDSQQRVRAALLRKSVPLRGPFSPGDLVCFFRRNRWVGPARIIGKEGRASVWLVHAGIPIVAPETSLRPATPTEVYAKQLLELRPSRKRLRPSLGVDSAGVHLPFSDDLHLPQQGDDEQSGYVELPSEGAGPSMQAEIEEPAAQRPRLEEPQPPQEERTVDSDDPNAVTQDPLRQESQATAQEPEVEVVPSSPAPGTPLGVRPANFRAPGCLEKIT